MPKTKSAENYFKRYSKFYLQGNSTCWRVEATDSISTPGIFEITAVEYYANEHEDDVALGVVGGLIEKEIDPNAQLPNEIP
jgi:predicted secreted protein